MDKSNPATGGYIAPLDGLRAVAILAVLLFHVESPLFKGGFVGVDVFFVISGFIITKGIAAELDRGRFSYRGFFARRLARLVPALLATITASAAAGYFLLTPRQLVEFGNSALAAAFSVSNIFFYFHTGYFDGNSALKPLLHTWSLGVEEQFYLVWPLIAILAYRLARLRGLVGAMAALGVVSLIAAIVAEPRAPEAVFYLTPFRVFQFSLGAVVGATGLRLSGIPATAATVVGFAAILLVSMLAPGAGSVSLDMLLPCVGAALFLLGLSSPVARLGFGNAVATAIGRRAYSVYLVHWPLIVFTRPVWTKQPEWIAVPALIAASFALGEILHRAVEERFRFHGAVPSPARKRRLLGVGAAQAVVVAVCVIFPLSGGLPFRFDENVVALVEATQLERAEIAKTSDYGRCILNTGIPLASFDPAYCVAVDPAKPTIAVLGDSFGIDTVTGLRDRFGSRYHFANASYASCPPFQPGPFKAGPPDCEPFNRLRLDLVAKSGIRTVLLTGNWTPGQEVPLAETVAGLRQKGLTVYVVGVRAAFDGNVPDLVVELGNVGTANDVLREHLLPNRAAFDQTMKAAVEKAGGIYLPVLTAQCGLTCPATAPTGELAYIDTMHLSRAGMGLLADTILERTGGGFRIPPSTPSR